MKTIPLTNSPLVALVDDEDFPLLNRINWYLGDHGYALNKRRSGSLYMHVLIAGFPNSNYMVDHKDRNRLNNQKDNLRLATRQTQPWNCKTPKGKKHSQYKGVYRKKYPKDRPWTAQIARTENGKSRRYYLGYFATEIEAARAYDAKAVELFGEFAAPNFPLRQHDTAQ